MWFSPFMWRGVHMGAYAWPLAVLRFVLPIVVIVGIGYLLYRLVRQPTVRMKEDPLEILKKRYAKGEITEEEFQKIKKNLLS